MLLRPLLRPLLCPLLRPLLCALLLICSCVSASAQTADELISDDLCLHQLQLIGTHNSYHIAPSESIGQLIRLAGADVLEALQYTHRPIVEQLRDLQMRQLELDLFADPEGGLFARPLGRTLAKNAGADPGPDPGIGGMLDKPGIKILHAPGFDFLSNVNTLRSALQQIEAWSASFPRHLPVMILLELKESVPNPTGVNLVPWTEVRLKELEDEIRSVIPRDGYLIPDDLKQAEDQTVRAAVRRRGWPQVGELRGKLFFCLDNEGGFVTRYLESSASDQAPLLFVSVPPDHPQAAWMKRNDPERHFAEIQQLVRSGFLVRTRADADTRQARANQTGRRDQAIASGAQYISTDFPEPVSTFSDYQVRWPEGQAAIHNRLLFPQR